MEYGSIARELHIDASPAVVYEVISSPEHLRQWWPDDAALDPVPGSTGEIAFGAVGTPDRAVVPVTVVEADPPRRFAFRWAYEQAPATETNSFLVTFDLLPSGAGTLVRFLETGFRERGWEAAVLEETYADHVRGWNLFLPRLVDHAGRAMVRR